MAGKKVALVVRGGGALLALAVLLTQSPHTAFVVMVLGMVAVGIFIARKLSSPQGGSAPEVATLGSRTQVRDWIACAVFLAMTYVIALRGASPFKLGSIFEVLGYMVPMVLLPGIAVVAYNKKPKPTAARSWAAFAFWTLVFTLVVTFAGRR